MWCDDSDTEDDADSRLAPSPRREVHVSTKPRPHDRLAIKEAFILAKYSERKFVAAMPPQQQGGLLWRGACAGDVRMTYAGLVGGADVKQRYDTAEAREVGQRTERLAGGSAAPQGGAGTTALHAAVEIGHMPTVELLCLAGARLDAREGWGRTPLECARLHGHDAVVELLRGRGGQV